MGGSISPHRAQTLTREPDSRDLLAAAEGGDQQAWASLVRRHSRLLFHVARSNGLTAEQSRDVVQTAWLRLIEHVDRIREPGSLASWLATTVSREAMAVLRRSRREVPMVGLDSRDPLQVDVDERLSAEHRARLLRRAVATLPLRERRLVQVLLEPDPPPYQEISRRLDMPVGSIGPVRQRALQHLRAALPDWATAGRTVRPAELATA